MATVSDFGGHNLVSVIAQTVLNGQPGLSSQTLNAWVSTAIALQKSCAIQVYLFLATALIKIKQVSRKIVFYVGEDNTGL